MLTYRILDSAAKQPVRDLQILHERMLHTFIVSKDFGPSPIHTTRIFSRSHRKISTPPR